MEANKIIIYFFILVCLEDGCLAGQPTDTYVFPTDTCFPDPRLIDEVTRVYLVFKGDFGGPECRRITLKSSKNPFYRYKICTKQLYYESPHCQSRLQYEPMYDDFHYNYNSRTLLSDGCKSSDSYSNEHDFYQCEYSSISAIDFVLRKNTNGDSGEYNKGYNYGRNPHSIFPDRVNDTFMIQIDFTVEYNEELIGGLSGGLVGLVVLVVAGISIFKCLRRRKRQTGSYCSPKVYKLGSLDGIKERLSDGFSTECTFAGITLCACVLCRRKEKVSADTYQLTEDDMKNKEESPTDCEKALAAVDGLKVPDTFPLLSDN